MTLTRLRILLGRASTIEEQCYWKREETELNGGKELVMEQ